MNAKQQNEVRAQVSAEEWQVRVDLAACYRLVALYGWDDIVFTHISARVPGPNHDDPHHFEAYMLLGNIYKTGGLKSRAVAMFRKALELKPDNDEAATQLAAVSDGEHAPPSGGGGIIKKLFGRG